DAARLGSSVKKPLTRALTSNKPGLRPERREERWSYRGKSVREERKRRSACRSSRGSPIPALCVHGLAIFKFPVPTDLRPSRALRTSQKHEAPRYIR